MKKNSGNHKFVEILGHVPLIDTLVLYKARILNFSNETIVHRDFISPIHSIASTPNEFDEVDTKRAEN